MYLRIKIITFLTLILTVSLSSANLKISDSTPTQEDTYLAYAEVMPQVQGGLPSIMKTIEYPKRAIQSGVQGVVYVMAFIDENGNINDAKVIKGIGAGCDEAAVAAVKKAKFSPAKNGGKAVRAKMSLPIKFMIAN